MPIDNKFRKNGSGNRVAARKTSEAERPVARLFAVIP